MNNEYREMTAGTNIRYVEKIGPTYLQFKKLHEDAMLPTRSHEGDAGLDLYSVEDAFIPVGSTIKVQTGIATSIPLEHYGKVTNRSSMSLKGLDVGAGIIDIGYHGDLSVVLHNINNTSNTHIGKKGYQIKKGDRIAQLLVLPCTFLQPVEVKELHSTSRNTNGFGSSGR